jgi:polar amino acid transport system substrate-binding protein
MCKQIVQERLSEKKMKNFNILIFIAITLFHFNLFSLEKEDIIVCTSANYNPIIYQTHDGKIVGLEAELLEEFASINHHKISYMVIKFDGLIPALLTKKCDIIATAMMMTEVRKKIVDFSLPIYQGKSYFIFKKNSKIIVKPNLDYFDTKLSNIGILQASAQDDYIKKNTHLFHFAKILYYESEADIIAAFSAKKISVSINGSQFYHLVQKKFPNVFDGVIFKDRDGKELTLPVGMPFRKDKFLLTKKFNAYMKELYRSGRLDFLLKKYEVQID